jgi:hypothetical protein
MPLPATLRRFAAPTALAGITWFVVVVTVMVAITNYSNIPGRRSPSPAIWPSQSHVTRDRTLPTLLMFAHPHCPCTRASVGELALFMARHQGRVRARVLFLQPEGVSQDWTRSDLWRETARIPGVQVSSDPAGAEAKLFGAETSGQCVLYSPEGELRFQGGITISRGHWGDNPGLSALEGQVSGKIATEVRTAVFGCSLGVMECRKE